MKNLMFVVFLLVIGVMFNSCGETVSDSSAEKWENKDGFVPDKNTAIQIAEVIGKRIYGKEIDDEKPFKASLINNVWIIDGTNVEGDGGVMHIEIQKADGKIIKIIHGK